MKRKATVCKKIKIYRRKNGRITRISGFINKSCLK